VLLVLVGASVGALTCCNDCARSCYFAASTSLSYCNLGNDCAFGALHQCPVFVLSVLTCSIDFATCPVAVYSIVLCSCGS
jgi:hypothetical protein